MSTNQQTLSQDTVFDLLSSARRRYIIYYLRQHGGEAAINEIASQIAVWENDIPEEELTSQDEKRVYVSLYQTHIPKLEEHGIVDYDSETGQVYLTDQAFQIDRYLGSEEREGLPWQLLYLAVAVVGAAVFGLVVLDVSLFAAIEPSVVGAVVIGTFVLMAVVQYVYRQNGPGEIPGELRVDGGRGGQSDADDGSEGDPLDG